MPRFGATSRSLVGLRELELDRFNRRFAVRTEGEQVLRHRDAAVGIHRRIPHSLPSLFPPRPTEGP